MTERMIFALGSVAAATCFASAGLLFWIAWPSTPSPLVAPVFWIAWILIWYGCRIVRFLFP